MLIGAPEFNTWLTQSKEVLFCPGGLGAGKTFVAATAIDHLLILAQKSDIDVAFVHCDFKDRAIQSAEQLLAALLRQIMQARRHNWDSLTEIYKRHSKRTTSPSFDGNCPSTRRRLVWWLAHVHRN